MALMYAANTTDLRSIMSTCNVYKRFIPSFASKAVPLNKQLEVRTSTKLDLNEGDLVATDEVRQNFIEPRYLALPKSDQPFTIETDIYDKQIRCVLLQHLNDERDLKPMCNSSGSRHDQERR